MSTFQLVENQCKSLEESQDKFNSALQQLDEHRNALKKKAKDKVEEWKRLLEESLNKVNQDIDAKLMPFEG